MSDFAMIVCFLFGWVAGWAVGTLAFGLLVERLWHRLPGQWWNQ